MKPTQTTELEPKQTAGSKRSTSRAGTSIVEALVALLVFALFVSGACKLLLSHRQLSDMARAHYQAANIAKNRMELVRTFDFDQLERFSESYTLINTSGTRTQNGNFRRSTSMRKLSGNLIELTIKVEIKDRKSLEFDGGEEEVVTYIARYLTEEDSIAGGVASN